jgi:hypothetical protein
VHQPGDRVRIRATGRRGIIVRADGLVLSVDVDGEVLVMAPQDVTNYSLAARKAWKTRP